MEIVGNAVIQKDGTLILPQEVIQRLELKFGDELFFVAKGGEITISKLPDAMKRTVDYYLAIGCDRLAAEYYAGGRKRLTGVKANPDFTLTLTYEEREERIYDCKPLLDKGGVFVHLRKYENFARVFIEYGAVCWDIDPNVDSNEVWNNRIDLCPDSCYIDSIPACAKGLTRDDMLRAKEAMLEMGIDIRDEDAVAGFAVSRKLLGLDRRKK